MATVKVIDLVSRGLVLLQDATAVRWPVLELQDWINDSYREIILKRPDANSTVDTFNCAAGTRQSLLDQFPNAVLLLDVVRNMAVNSDLGAVRQISRKTLDDQRNAWHGEKQTDDIEYYSFDPLLPKQFLVYPPALTSAQLEVVYSSVPTAHVLTAADLVDAGNAEVIKIDDSYANAILDYVLYRAFSKDTENIDLQRANHHMMAMQSSLGLPTSTEAA